MNRSVKVGDYVRRRSNIYAVGTVIRMIRADAYYFRRAEVQSKTGETWIAPVDDLVLDDPNELTAPSMLAAVGSFDPDEIPLADPQSPDRSWYIDAEGWVKTDA